jgi:predicted transcriptional regulator
MVTTTTLKLDIGIKDRVKRLAEAQRRTPHWVMCEAITEYVQRAEARETFRVEALASLAEYRTTGLHLTGAEVEAWLETWGTDQETEAPACHK